MAASADIQGPALPPRLPVPLPSFPTEGKPNREATGPARQHGPTRRALLAAPLALAAPPTRAAPPAAPLLSLVVGSPPGRGADPSARAFAPFLERHLRDVRVAVLNRPGEAGLSALRLLAGADPSGLTLGWVASPTLQARMVDRGEPGLLGRLHLVGAVRKEPVVFVSSPHTPLATLADLLHRAREESGAAAASMALGTPPPGSPAHLAALRLQSLSGIRLHIVAFPSAAAARQAAQDGHAAAAALALPDAIAALREGSLAGLGIATRRPATALPEIAPLHASGIPLQSVILRGLALPAAPDPGRLAALQSALARIAADPEFIAAAEETGFQPLILPGPAWTTHVQEDHARLAALWSTTPWPPTPTG